MLSSILSVRASTATFMISSLCLLGLSIAQKVTLSKLTGIAGRAAASQDDPSPVVSKFVIDGTSYEGSQRARVQLGGAALAVSSSGSLAITDPSAAWIEANEVELRPTEKGWFSIVHPTAGTLACSIADRTLANQQCAWMETPGEETTTNFLVLRGSDGNLRIASADIVRPLRASSNQVLLDLSTFGGEQSDYVLTLFISGPYSST